MLNCERKSDVLMASTKKTSNACFTSVMACDEAVLVEMCFMFGGYEKERSKLDVKEMKGKMKE